jgi:hypothetical protein
MRVRPIKIFGPFWHDNNNWKITVWSKTDHDIGSTTCWAHQNSWSSKPKSAHQYSFLNLADVGTNSFVSWIKQITFSNDPLHGIWVYWGSERKVFRALIVHYLRQKMTFRWLNSFLTLMFYRRLENMGKTQGQTGCLVPSVHRGSLTTRFPKAKSSHCWGLLCVCPLSLNQMGWFKKHNMV